MKRTFGGLDFQHIGDITLRTDDRGNMELIPRDEDRRFHKHGHGPFCSFTLAGCPQAGGVYLIAGQSKVLYVGESQDVSRRLKYEYGQISYAKRCRNGQVNSCRINTLILHSIQRGDELSVWFYGCLVPKPSGASPVKRRQRQMRKAIEASLIYEYDPPWNRW